MEVSYKRDLNRNYLIINNNSIDYQIRMLMENSSAGFGKIKLSNWDGEESIMYDVTGLQSMDRFFSRKKIGFDEFAEILYSISKMVNECARLLLDSSGLIMNPEYIFWDINEEKPVWIFYPYEEHNNQISTLSEFILDHIDNTDSRVVKAAYELYKKSKGESISSENLFTLLENESSFEIKDIKEETLRENTGKVCEAEYTSFIKDGRKIEKVNRKTEESQHRKDSAQLIPNIIIGIQKKWKGLFKKTKKESYGIYSGYDELRRSICELSTDQFEDNDETMLIDITDCNNAHRLISRSDFLKDEILASFPCVIGSKKDAVDIYISDKSVSRKHAIIDLIDGNMILLDCSKNGTFLNGVRLRKEEAILSKGDEISFGNVKFILS